MAAQIKLSLDKQQQYEKRLQADYRTDLALIAFYKRKARKPETKQALDNLAYFIIVNHHRQIYSS